VLSKILSKEYKIDLVTYSLGQDVEISNVTIYRTPKFFKPKIGVGKPSIGKLGLDMFVFFKCIFLMFKNDYDILHCEDFEAAVLGRILIIFKKNIKFVYDLHNRLLDNLRSKGIKVSGVIEKVILIIEKSIIKRSNLIILNWRKYEDDKVFKNKNTITYYDQINIGEFKECVLPAKEYLIYTGNFEKYQGHLEFLEAYSQSQGSYSLVLIGDITEEVSNFIKSNEKLSRTVIVLGRLSIEESNYLIVNSLAGILPRLDGSSMKVIHYLMLGKPVIAKNTISNRELLKNEYNGLLYENINELINVLDLINSDRDVLNKLKLGVEETAKSIKGNWDQPSFLKKYEI